MLIRRTGQDITYVNENDHFHRLDGPAILWSSGSRSWFRDGLAHRDDGPAYEGYAGGIIWYRHGLKHRMDGPAVITANGRTEYWIDGVHVAEQDLPL